MLGETVSQLKAAASVLRSLAGAFFHVGECQKAVQCPQRLGKPTCTTQVDGIGQPVLPAKKAVEGKCPFIGLDGSCKVAQLSISPALVSQASTKPDSRAMAFSVVDSEPLKSPSAARPNACSYSPLALRPIWDG